MFCSNCGTQMPDGSKFCASCGNQMSAPVQAAQPVQPQPVQPKPVQPQPVQPMYANQTMPVTIQGSKFNWKVFIIMMLVGLLSGGKKGFQANAFAFDLLAKISGVAILIHLFFTVLHIGNSLLLSGVWRCRDSVLQSG